MIIGLLADVHGNRHALQAVLDAATRERVAHLLIAGDLVGYYYDPLGCFEAVRAWPATWVRGNHEDLLDEFERDPQRADALRAKYGSGFDVASTTLPAAVRSEMAAWPRVVTVSLDGRRIRLCHGAPWATDDYLYPDAPASTWARMAADDDDLVVFGHTHYRVDRTVERTRIVNPGSVGQPRDGSGGACWAVYDTSTGACDWRVETYDRDAVAHEARVRDPHLPYLADVLFRETSRV